MDENGVIGQIKGIELTTQESWEGLLELSSKKQEITEDDEEDMETDWKCTREEGEKGNV